MLRQLIKKELHLQRSSLFFALAVILVWGVLITMTREAARELIPRQLTMGQLVSLLQAFFIGPCLLAIVPLFAGAALVAEERRLGVWDWHLSLPAPRALQWTLKLTLAAAIVLVIALLVAPGLDAAMTRALAGRGDPFPLPTFYLRFNAGYFLLPLLLMAAGAFVSSLASDPYKAFFGGLVIFAVALACTRLADPASLLLMPWMRTPSPNAKILLTTNFAPLLMIAISVILGWAAWFNFRYEALRWRRLVLELVTMVVLISAATALVLRWEFNPAKLISQKKSDVEPFILGERRNLGMASPAIDWTGIEPLLVKRQPTADRWAMDFWGRRPIAHLYRLSGTSRLLAEVNSFPVYFASSEPSIWNQIVEIDLATHRLRPLYSLVGFIQHVIPKYSAYIVCSAFGMNATYLITHWPVPIRVGGLLCSLWTSNKKEINLNGQTYGYSSQFSPLQNKEAMIDGKKVKFEGASPINVEQGIHQIFFKREPVYQTWLIRQKPDRTWKLIDEQQGYMQYAVTSDGKWFARGARTDSGYPSKTLVIQSVDSPTSWSLSSPQGNLILSVNPVDDLYWAHQGSRPLGSASTYGRTMPVSPSGRYLPFLRTQSIMLEDLQGQPRDTGYPQQIELALLDLQTGKEIVLQHMEPAREVEERFRREMQQWLWDKWLRQSGMNDLAGLYRLKADLPPNPELHWPMHYPSFPPMIWAKEHDALAVLYNGQVQLFEMNPDAAARLKSQPGAAASALEAMGGFVLTCQVDLTGFQIASLDFWDEKSLLVWGQLGLFKIDLTQPR